MNSIKSINFREFYDSYSNFVNRTLLEYYLSPGIRCKFNTILNFVKKKNFLKALDIGCSGNSFIHFLPSVKHRVFCDLAHLPLKQYNKYKLYHPTGGSITSMPFKDGSFDLITALDVLEHIPEDHIASSEIMRILAPKGLLLITVPHRMKFFTKQDEICGHVRRYELSDIKILFSNKNLKRISIFPVYGQLMRIQFLQEINPQKIEQSITKLRSKYEHNGLFRLFWNIFVKIGAKIMQLDARYQPFHRIMDICVVFRKSG